jgi:nitroimidazol reductase NimA-like FMN-containing flavoprotein (pyridoxamine 5'-phosphate oxidase superfamily)
MPREHATIKMSFEELAKFVSAETRCIVGTLDEDGGPWGDAASCVFRDERLYFRVPMATRTLRNLDRDDRVCCTIESHPAGSEYYTIKAAIFHGRAQRAESETAQELAGVFAGLLDPVDGEAQGPIFSVGVDDVVSFDFAKIVRRFEE